MDITEAVSRGQLLQITREDFKPFGIFACKKSISRNKHRSLMPSKKKDCSNTKHCYAEKQCMGEMLKSAMGRNVENDLI